MEHYMSQFKMFFQYKMTHLGWYQTSYDSKNVLKTSSDSTNVLKTSFDSTNVLKTSFDKYTQILL